jgi:hypothetical protein
MLRLFVFNWELEHDTYLFVIKFIRVSVTETRTGGVELISFDRSQFILY